MRAERAVEPTRSENITVTWRRRDRGKREQRTAYSGLRLVHRRVRQARSEGDQDVARRACVISPSNHLRTQKLGNPNLKMARGSEVRRQNFWTAAGGPSQSRVCRNGAPVTTCRRVAKGTASSGGMDHVGRAEVVLLDGCLVKVAACSAVRRLSFGSAIHRSSGAPHAQSVCCPQPAARCGMSACARSIATATLTSVIPPLSCRR